MALDTLHIAPTDHHAYALHGDIEATRDALFETLESEWGIQTSANPDVSYEYTETLSVDTARRLVEQAHRKPMHGQVVLIVSFLFANREAQHGLLKLLEEPPERTTLFLIVSDLGGLLPTIRSRIVEISGVRKHDHAFAETFLQARPADRLEQCVDIISNKDKQGAAMLFDALETTLYTKHANRLQEFEWQQGIRTLLDARAYLSERSPSVKMLVEHVALTLPVASE